MEREKREFIVAQVLSVFKFKPGFKDVPDEFRDEAERGDKKFCLVQLLQPVSGKPRKDKNGQVIQPRKKQFGEQVFRLSVYLDTKEPEIRVMSISNIVVFFDSLTRTGTIPAKALKDGRDRASAELINHQTDARVNALIRRKDVIAAAGSSENNRGGARPQATKRRAQRCDSSSSSESSISESEFTSSSESQIKNIYDGDSEELDVMTFTQRMKHTRVLKKKGIAHLKAMN